MPTTKLNIAVFGRIIEEKVTPYIKQMFEQLKQQNIEVTIFEPFHNFLKQKKIIEGEYKTFVKAQDLDKTDYMFSIGGDGTLLESVLYNGSREIPILGINAGRLGFLANITVDRIPQAIEALLNKKFRYDDRILVNLETNEDLFSGINYALNEFAIVKRDNSSMILVHAYLNGEFLNSYWSDGLIVSTPTGSTGYSLSCGGPLVMPQTNNFIISPINPHNLNVRPMIVPDDSQLTFKIEGRSKKFLISLDSRSKSVNDSIQIKVSKANFHARLIELENTNYFNTLRNKLNWGLDIRN